MACLPGARESFDGLYGWQCALGPGGTPTTVAGFMNAPQDLGVDASHVYFTDTGDNTVWRVLKAGGTAEKLAGGQNNPAFLALDGDYVYWVNVYGQSIARVAKVGGAVQTIVTTTSYPVAIAVDGENVYWVQAVENNYGAFFRAPKVGGSPTLVGTPTSTTTNFEHMAAAQGRLAYPLKFSDGPGVWTPTERFPMTGPFLMGRGGEVINVTNGQIDGTGNTTLAPAVPPLDIASDSCAHYTLTSSAVFRFVDPAFPQILSAATNPRRIAVDEAYVYWTEGRTVRRIAKGQ